MDWTLAVEIENIWKAFLTFLSFVFILWIFPASTKYSNYYKGYFWLMVELLKAQTQRWTSKKLQSQQKPSKWLQPVLAAVTLPCVSLCGCSLKSFVWWASGLLHNLWVRCGRAAVLLVLPPSVWPWNPAVSALTTGANCVAFLWWWTTTSTKEPHTNTHFKENSDVLYIQLNIMVCTGLH